MAEITPIDPIENVTSPRIPRLADLSGLAKLQKPRQGEESTVDGTGYVTRYLQEREDMAQDVTGGQQAMYFAPEATIAETEKARQAEAMRMLDAGEISAADYANIYHNQRPDNFANIENADFERWLDQNLRPEDEATRGAIMAQFEPIYLKDFHEKFLEHRRDYAKKVVHTNTTETITLNTVNATNYIQSGNVNNAVAGLQQQRLMDAVADGISSGEPIPPNVIVREQKAIADKMKQAESDLDTGKGLFSVNEGLIAGASMSHVYTPNDTESQRRNNSYAYQGALITSELSAMHIVKNAVAGEEFDAFKISQGTGVTPQNIDPVGREAGKDYDLTSMRDALPGIVDRLELPLGMTREDRMALGEQFIAGIERKMKSADDAYDVQSTELAETYSNYSWDIMMTAKLDSGGLLLDNEKDAAQNLINNMQMAVDREQMKSSDADPIIARLKSAIDYQGPDEDETPDNVKINLYMAGLEGIISMIQGNEKQMDFRDALGNNTNYVDDDGKVWDMTYPIWHEIQQKVDLMGPYNELWSESQRLIRQTSDPVLAQKILEATFLERQQLTQGTYNEDVATANIGLVAFGLDRDTPKNKDFKAGGEIVWKINTGEVAVNLGNQNDIMMSIQSLGNFDKEHLGSMLSEDGYAMAAKPDMYIQAYRNANLNDTESDLAYDAIQGNLLGRALGFDAQGQPLTAIRSGDFVTTKFAGVDTNAYKVDVFGIGHETIPFSTDLDPDKPMLTLLGGRESNRDINYYMVENPDTHLMELWSGVVQSGTADRYKAVTLGESISASMGINGDLMQHLHNSGVEGGVDIIPAQQSLQTDHKMMLYINKRESEYIGPEGHGNLPQAVIENDEKFAPLPTAYEYDAMFYGTDEYVPPIVDVRNSIVDRVHMDPEEARYRNLGAYWTKDELVREENMTGVFTMPTRSWRPKYTSDPDRDGNKTTVDEGFEDTDYTDEYGDYIKVPAVIAGEVKMRYFSGEPGAAQDAMEFYEFWLSQQREGGLR